MGRIFNKGRGLANYGLERFGKETRDVISRRSYGANNGAEKDVRFMHYWLGINNIEADKNVIVVEFKILKKFCKMGRIFNKGRGLANYGLERFGKETREVISRRSYGANNGAERDVRFIN